MNREIEDLTKLINPKAKTKTYAQQKAATIWLISHYQVYQTFDKVDAEILYLAIEWSKGNA